MSNIRVCVVEEAAVPCFVLCVQVSFFIYSTAHIGAGVPVLVMLLSVSVETVSGRRATICNAVFISVP